MRQPLHLFLAQPRASIHQPLQETDSLSYTSEQCGTGRGVLTITEKYLQSNIRHGLFQQHFFFSQANISFPFVIYF